MTYDVQVPDYVGGVIPPSAWTTGSRGSGDRTGYIKATMG